MTEEGAPPPEEEEVPIETEEAPDEAAPEEDSPLAEDPPAAAEEEPPAAPEEGGGEEEVSGRDSGGDGGVEGGGEPGGGGGSGGGEPEARLEKAGSDKGGKKDEAGGEGGEVENRKIVRMQEINPVALPTSYSQNGDEELLVLEYIENFRRQFVQLYPDRKELLLCPRNECGLEKFICTTIRPTKLEYNELYDLEACAFFVAEHIQYEALQDETQLPRYVPSPSSVLKWQIGDCIDMSILLASFLLGVGSHPLPQHSHLPDQPRLS